MGLFIGNYKARRVARARTTIAAEAKHSRARTIDIAATTYEPWVRTVHKVGVYFTVYNLFHQHDETKNNLLPFSFLKENGRFRKHNQLLIFFAKKIKRKCTQLIQIFSIKFYAVPVLRTGSVREKKEPELTPKLFGHSIQCEFSNSI